MIDVMNRLGQEVITLDTRLREELDAVVEEIDRKMKESTNTLSNHHLGVHLVPCHQRPNVALDYSASDSSERANRNLQGYSKLDDPSPAVSCHSVAGLPLDFRPFATARFWTAQMQRLGLGEVAKGGGRGGLQSGGSRR